MDGLEEKTKKQNKKNHFTCISITTAELFFSANNKKKKTQLINAYSDSDY